MRGSQVGLEKESLRVTPRGTIAQSDHPSGLGAALTHPHITTDYSESLLELITRPHHQASDALNELDNLHRWIYPQLENDEMLWTTSMPCVLQGDRSIRIADYGPSNAGMMKTVYRRGLAYRYGKMMQVIAGVHYNYSLSDAFWQAYQSLQGVGGTLTDFRSDCYMAMLRNIQRFGWLIPYLFGASPAICKSFLEGQPTTLEYFGRHTYYEPFATSLRMGDIGYQNTQEERLGVWINYDSLDQYIASLESATQTPCPEYAKIGVRVNGEYRQLNSRRLQIENEYYSSARAKAITNYLQKPVRALQQKGIEYLELRSLDLNAFEPLGVDEQQLCFLETFMLYTLLCPSPPITDTEMHRIDDNFSLVAHAGRDPKLMLNQADGKIPLKQWALELLDNMEEIASWLDARDNTLSHRSTLATQKEAVTQPDQLPSAQMLETMRQDKLSFFEFALERSQEITRYFQQRPLDMALHTQYATQALQSTQKAKDIAIYDNKSFDDFLETYFSQ